MLAFASATPRVAPRIRATTRKLRPALPRGRSLSVVRAVEGGEDRSADEIAGAMAAARACEEGGLSPGAGLTDADAQADAAFADMINTTVDVTGEQLDEEALDALARGGRMDAESTSKRSGGFVDDVKDLFGALSKGAHIVRQKGGRV